MTLRIAAARPLPPVAPGDDLGALVAGALGDGVADDDVLVVSHKVVSKAEGRVVALASVEPGPRALEIAAEHEKDPRLVEVVLSETVRVVAEARGVMICETRHGLVCANAGVDRSNADPDTAVLLPEDPDGSARRLRAAVAERSGARPAVVIADSFGRAWRVGQTDVAIGAAGLVVLDDWHGRFDSGGRELVATSIAVGDAVAAAADLARAKDSLEPVVVVSGLGRFVTREDGPGAAALRREPEQDLFR